MPGSNEDSKSGLAAVAASIEAAASEVISTAVEAAAAAVGVEIDVAVT
eukprot:CAMPEP_0113517324 /NCGR_PEP_ID=MMETSP0014_2-20120614/42172_1 /TAXON_ID=2857 /ORGANISM="Nitzschia sp." /LENGTH=47 /DNA_ID=CAMNT_0000414461 /DNA_START=127 /DNA_END=267 /DNA_ORIENTATION=+ /assembly_acc=CAM_ASM_000159